MRNIDRLDRIAVGHAPTHWPPPELMKLGTDSERYLYCKAMAERYRALWYQGKAEMQERLSLLPTKSMRIRYARYPVEARLSIGARLWSTSVQAQEYVDQEQMFSRWMFMYATAISTTVDPHNVRRVA